MYKMKRTKTQKGITLIALIITIIVLLILAVVAIGALQNTGIITHAKNASSETTIAQEKEQITLGVSGWKVEKHTPTTHTFKSYITEVLTNEAVVTGEEAGPLEVKFIKTDREVQNSKVPYSSLLEFENFFEAILRFVLHFDKTRAIINDVVY